MSASVSLPGFTDPVRDAQSTFRAVLDAMARPGRLHHVGQNLTVPAPLDRATAAVLLTLIDNETPLWMDPAAVAARDWLAFHCGATIVEAPEASDVRARSVAAEIWKYCRAARTRRPRVPQP